MSLRHGSGETTCRPHEALQAACVKIKTQFPDCEYGRLMFAVVERAILDLTDSRVMVIEGADGKKTHERIKDDALRYLCTDMPHALACGVNPEWIKRIVGRVIEHCGILGEGKA